MRIDTSEKKLFDLAEFEYGQEEAAQMRLEYASMTSSQQCNYRAEKAAYFVKNQAPCENMSRKEKKGLF